MANIEAADLTWGLTCCGKVRLDSQKTLEDEAKIQRGAEQEAQGSKEGNPRSEQTKNEQATS